MLPLQPQTPGSLVTELAASLAAGGGPGREAWPPVSLVEKFEKAEGAPPVSDQLAQVLLQTTLDRPRSAVCGRLEAAVRGRLPPEALDQLDFVIASHLINHDEYLRWMIQMVGGWLSINDGNCHCFSHAIRHMPEGGAVIEIGSFLGVSVSALSYLLLRHGRTSRLFNADPWMFEETEKPIGGFFDAASREYRDYCVETYKRNISLFAGRNPPTTVEAMSDDFFLQWSQRAEVVDVFGNRTRLGGPISFAYIDGAHTYEAAQRDFENVVRDLLPGGFVLFDDSNPRLSFGCVQSAAEAASTPGFRRVFGHVDGLNVLIQKTA